jgi:allophanate hydrolase subunit 1
MRLMRPWEMSRKRESTIPQECQAMSSNRQDHRTHSVEADSAKEVSEDSQALRDFTINLDKVEAKAKQEQAILSVISSKNSRNSSEDSRDREEVEELKHR